MSIRELIEGARRALADAEHLAQMQGRGWIRIDDVNLPPDGVEVLLWPRPFQAHTGCVYRGSRREDGSWADVKWHVGNTEGRAHSCGITHWMPLPEGPESEK